MLHRRGVRPSLMMDTGSKRNVDVNWNPAARHDPAAAYNLTSPFCFLVTLLLLPSFLFFSVALGIVMMLLLRPNESAEEAGAKSVWRWF